MTDSNLLGRSRTLDVKQNQILQQREEETNDQQWFINTIFEPDQLIEVRIIRDKDNISSGYYTDRQKLYADVALVDNDPAVKGIYVVLNKIDPAILTQRPDQINRITKGKATAKENIIQRRWMVLDFDPVKSTTESNSSSTDAEKAEAFDRAQQCENYLTSLGFPEPIKGDSGNGAHRIYRINLPNDQKSLDLIASFLKVLNTKFGVDVVMKDAPRISKLYGTVARKGINTPERPHRRSRLISVPTTVQIVTNDMMQIVIEKENHTGRYSGIQAPATVKEGVITMRHPELKMLVTSMVARNNNDATIHAAAVAMNKTQFSPPKGDQELKDEVDSLIKWAREQEAKKAKENENGQIYTQITEQQMQDFRDEHIKSFSELPPLPDGFFKDYMDYGIRMSYAYSAFHFGNALALISLVARRRIVMKSTGATIYPNVYVACIGQTSTSGKSTACDMMYNEFFSLVRKEQTVTELTKKMSPQGLIERIATIPSRLWYYDECSEFFSDIANRWAESLESIMCSLYDGRAISYGLSKGKNKQDEYKAENTFLTCVWNTTNSEMESRAQWSHVTNGFLPRWMWFWCHGKNTPRLNRPISQEDRDFRHKLLKQIQKLATILDNPKLAHMQQDMVMFLPNEKIELWKLNDDLKHLDKEDELHRIATARLAPQGYKISMLFAIMDNDVISLIENTGTFPLQLKIPDKYAELSIDICDHYLRPRLEYLIDLSKNNDTKNFQIQVIRCLKNHDGIAKKSLVMHETHINKRNFDETLVSLLESETIEICEVTTVGRPAQVVKLLK